VNTELYGRVLFLAVIVSFVINAVFKIELKYTDKFNFLVRFHWKYVST